jgi:hypothetical protein
MQSMPSPFPGMNPYLETPERWPGVHHWLINELARSLGKVLPANYYVAVEERVYGTTEAESALIGIPENSVVQSSNASAGKTMPSNAQSSKQAVLPKPMTVNLPMPITVHENYLELRQVKTQKVITVIEVLSPKNKRPGIGRTQYEEKRYRTLASRSHLIEIDLLRKGKLMEFSGENTSTNYRILVSRRQQRPKADLYGFNLQEKIPLFPVPLEDAAVEPVLDLKPMLDTLYDVGRYGLQIDYTHPPPEPILSAADAEWCDRCVLSAGLMDLEG